MHPSFSFFCLCMYVWSWFSHGWPHSLHAPCDHPFSKVNKCMRTLVGWHQIQTLKGAKLPPRLNQRLKKIPERNPKKEKIPKPRQIQSPKGKKLCVYWLVFCDVCDLLYPPPIYAAASTLANPKLCVFLKSLFKRALFKKILAMDKNTVY